MTLDTVVEAANNFGDTREGAGAGPLALAVVALLAIATILLWRNMTARIKRLPASFPAQAPGGGRQGPAGDPQASAGEPAEATAAAVPPAAARAADAAPVEARPADAEPAATQPETVATDAEQASAKRSSTES